MHTGSHRVLRHGCAEAWGDGKLGVDDFSAPAFAGLDLLGLFLDPVNWVVGKILEPILNWILENVKPLKKTIEVITGSPEQVQAQAAQYQRVGEQVAEQANQLIASANRALDAWEGQARDSFRVVVQAAVDTQASIAEKQHQLANLMYSLASIVSAVKEIVVTLIKEFVTELVTKAVMVAIAAVPTLGAAVAAYTAWAAAKYALVMGKVARAFSKLFAKASKLVGKASRLGQLFMNISNRLGKLADKFDDIVKLRERSLDSKDNAVRDDAKAEKAQSKVEGRTPGSAAQRRAERRRDRHVEGAERHRQNRRTGMGRSTTPQMTSVRGGGPLGPEPPRKATEKGARQGRDVRTRQT